MYHLSQATPCGELRSAFVASPESPVEPLEPCVPANVVTTPLLATITTVLSKDDTNAAPTATRSHTATQAGLKESCPCPTLLIMFCFGEPARAEQALAPASLTEPTLHGVHGVETPTLGTYFGGAHVRWRKRAKDGK